MSYSNFDTTGFIDCCYRPLEVSLYDSKYAYSYGFNLTNPAVFVRKFKHGIYASSFIITDKGELCLEETFFEYKNRFVKYLKLTDGLFGNCVKSSLHRAISAYMINIIYVAKTSTDINNNFVRNDHGFPVFAARFACRFNKVDDKILNIFNSCFNVYVKRTIIEDVNSIHRLKHDPKSKLNGLYSNIDPVKLYRDLMLARERLHAERIKDDWNHEQNQLRDKFKAMNATLLGLKRRFK